MMTTTYASNQTFTLDVRGAFLRRTDLSRASLKGANLSNADFSNAVLRDVDFENAILDGTILKGADLTGARNLTRAQLKKAIIDSNTRLPDSLAEVID